MSNITKPTSSTTREPTSTATSMRWLVSALLIESAVAVSLLYSLLWIGGLV